MSPEGKNEKPGFMIAPPAIPAKDIKETVDTEVLVIGCGIAGLTASLSARQAGARVVVIEKLPSFNFRGGWNAAFNSRIQKEAGINVDKEEVIATIMETGSYRTDQRVVSKWAYSADAVFEWILDMAEKDGQPVILDPVQRPWYFRHYPIGHLFVSRDKGNSSLQMNLANLLYKNGEKAGVQYRFETPAVQLLRKANGRVSGAIAKNAQGEYIQFNAEKGVILSSGDYGNNREMVEHYCGWRASALFDISQAYADATVIATGAKDGKVNVGDGQKMGMWIGAAMDDAPHCVMYFDRSNAGAPPDKIAKKGQILMRYFLDIPRQPWLCVNLNGQRFMNEDIPWAFECNQYMTQPQGMAYKVWDSKYELEWPRFHAACCKSIGEPMYRHKPDFVQKGIEWGAILVANSIEELAKKMEVPVETFAKTVNRYNTLAKDGKDLDFGKNDYCLTTVNYPPFYACKVSGQYMVTMGGLKINPELQVLDTNRQPIPGLYAAGNVSGSFYGDEYPVTVPGASHSRAWTFGYLAGKAAAASEP